MKESFLKDYFNDGVAWALKTLEYPHHETHEGRAFYAIYSATKDNAGFIEVRFRPNHATRRCHMAIHVESALAATAQIWLGTTKTHVVANRIIPLNRDFSSGNASILSLCHTPAGVQAGTTDYTKYIGAATTGGRSDIGGSASSRGEFILEPFQDYLITLTSRVNSNALSIELDWYEHVSKE